MVLVMPFLHFSLNPEGISEFLWLKSVCNDFFVCSLVCLFVTQRYIKKKKVAPFLMYRKS